MAAATSTLTLRNTLDNSTYEVSEKAVKCCDMLQSQAEDGGDEELMMMHKHGHLLPYLVGFIEYYARHPYHKTDDDGKVTWFLKRRSPVLSEEIDWENEDREPATWYAEFTYKFGPKFDEKEELKDEGDARWYEVNNELVERTNNVFNMLELADYLGCDSLYQLMHWKIGEIAWKGRNAGIFPLIAARLPRQLLKKENDRSAREAEACKLAATDEWKGKRFIEVLQHVYALHLPKSVGGLMEERGEDDE